MKRLLYSIGASVFIVAMAFVGIITSGYLSLEKRIAVPEIISMVCGWVISWPLVVFKGIFLNRPGAASPQSPTAESFLAMLVLDVVLYSLMIYGALLCRAKRQ
jgi:hypothetical protein